MSWVAVGVTAAGVVKGTLDAKAAKKKQAKHDAFRKASIQYSPWTDMQDPGAGNFGNTSATSGALGGGLQGFAMGSSINNMAGVGGAGAGQGGAAQAAGMPVARGAGKSPWAGMAMNYQKPAIGSGRMG